MGNFRVPNPKVQNEAGNIGRGEKFSSLSPKLSQLPFGWETSASQTPRPKTRQEISEEAKSLVVCPRNFGKVVTVYYFWDKKTGPERYIAATIWDPGKVTE